MTALQQGLSLVIADKRPTAARKVLSFCGRQEGRTPGLGLLRQDCSRKTQQEHPPQEEPPGPGPHSFQSFHPHGRFPSTGYSAFSPSLRARPRLSFDTIKLAPGAVRGGGTFAATGTTQLSRQQKDSSQSSSSGHTRIHSNTLYPPKALNVHAVPLGAPKQGFQSKAAASAVKTQTVPVAVRASLRLSSSYSLRLAVNRPLFQEV